MSTHSLIGILFDDNIEYVYCHFDGYPEHMLPILTQKYANNTKAFELVSLGNLSYISQEGAEAFHIDQGEGWEGNQPVQGASMGEFKSDMERLYADHGYLFDCQKKQWLHIKR
ncbi:MAG: hypothetical protein L3J67_11125 [Hyphomicrobiaceae bacterium]|nr:hypothetical protein [Hyphomicrobiaceae bacterium]